MEEALDLSFDRLLMMRMMIHCADSDKNPQPLTKCLLAFPVPNYVSIERKSRKCRKCESISSTTLSKVRLTPHLSSPKKFSHILLIISLIRVRYAHIISVITPAFLFTSTEITFNIYSLYSHSKYPTREWNLCPCPLM